MFFVVVSFISLTLAWFVYSGLSTVQTEVNVKSWYIKLEKDANKTHYKVGKEIRNTIKKLGGTMPESLPTPDKSLKELERENKKLKD